MRVISPALEYANRNMGRCNVAITITDLEGNVVGTEQVGVLSQLALQQVVLESMKYTTQLTKSRVRAARFHGYNRTE